jgi:hypothetical protein
MVLRRSLGLLTGIQGFNFIYHKYMGGHTLVGRLSGIWTQTGIVTASNARLYTGTFVRPPCLQGNAGRAPSLHKYYTPDIRLTTEDNHGKTSVGVAENAQLQIVGHDSFGRLGAVSRATSTGLPAVITFGLRLGWLAHPSVKYLPSCPTKGFHASANFESKLTVRALMWSAKNGTPISSWICLLLMYQGALVAIRRHLDLSICSFMMWLRAADLQTGHT